MNDKKFEFTVKEKDEIELMFDTDCLLSDVFKRIEQIISSRSASPQQGTEGAEEVLMKTDKLNIDIVDTANGKILHIMLVDAIKAMHQFAQSQVEQAVKEKDAEIRTIERHRLEDASSANDDMLVQYERIKQLEHALKVQTEHVADLMASSLVRPELKVPSEEGFDSQKAHDVANSIVTELIRAKSLFPAKFVNQHEAYAVVLEEIDELWAEIKKNQRNYDLEAQRKEATQAAAMLVRLIVELL